MGRDVEEEEGRRSASGGEGSSSPAYLICHQQKAQVFRFCQGAIVVRRLVAARTSDSRGAKPKAHWVFLVRCVDCRGRSSGVEPHEKRVVTSPSQVFLSNQLAFF